jgi:hypothetical protein
VFEFLRRVLRRRRSEAAPEATPSLPDPTLPFELLWVPGREALQERSRLLSRPQVTPVIMGDPDDLRRLEEGLQGSAETTEAILASATGLDVDQWLRARSDEDPEHYSVPSGEWPTGEVRQTELSVHLDALSKQPRPRVAIGLVPAPLSWQVPAHVRSGGWNDCPTPDVHVAIHRRWHERYGADIACLSIDVIECTVRTPPSSRQSALALAREQFVYCPDIVHQGVESLEALAATLLDGKAWYFWWD